MRAIFAAVGLDGTNDAADVISIQNLLNENRGRIFGGRDVAVDGICGPQTIRAIKLFQEQLVKAIVPDGRVDPDGLTFRELAKNVKIGPPSVSSIGTSSRVSLASFRFPLRRRPSADYHHGPGGGHRYFGADRKTHSGGKRSHAGVDLIAPKGTEILAIADGEVIQDMYPFYLGTYALEVRHDSGVVVRYGEIMGVAPGVKKGGKVKRGEIIAYVGRLSTGSSMLHFEMYAGTANGQLTTGIKPYYRRADLMDPTAYLDSASLV